MEGNSLKTIENLCKIFETRIRLDKEKNINTPDEVLNNYEKYAKKIDEIYNERFERNLKKLITPEDTLEKEEKRLNKLIELLNNRKTERIELESKFYKTTGSYIRDLQLIVSENELQSKKERLEAITKYLDTTNEIETIKESIEKLEHSLAEESIKEDEYKKKNKIIEDVLYSSFKDVIEKDEYLSTINEDDINEEIDNILDKVNDNKETLDVTKDSVSSLISIGNEEDYSMYIEDAERNYYLWKNRELLLRIYKIVDNFEEEFSAIYEKRIELSKIIKNRKSIINSLSYEVKDELFEFEKIIENDLDFLKVEKEILENITSYNNRITFKEERLNELNEINNSDEILSILREYNLIDTYSNTELEENVVDVIENENNEDIINSGLEENIVNEFYDPYRIIEIKDYPKTLNIGLAKLKGESVREKVNKKLNPESNGSTFSEINKDINIEIPSVIQKEEPIETKEAPSLEKAEEIPVWSSEIIKKEEPVVWELPNIELKEENVPVWTELKEENQTQKDTELSDSSFWTSVDNNESNSIGFPSINVPVNMVDNSNNNFGFPEIDN